MSAESKRDGAARELRHNAELHRRTAASQVGRRPRSPAEPRTRYESRAAGHEPQPRLIAASHREQCGRRPPTATPRAALTSGESRPGAPRLRARIRLSPPASARVPPSVAFHGGCCTNSGRWRKLQPRLARLCSDDGRITFRGGPGDLFGQPVGCSDNEDAPARVCATATMQPGRASGHRPYPRALLPSLHASERRRVQASDARPRQVAGRLGSVSETLVPNEGRPPGVPRLATDELRRHPTRSAKRPGARSA